MKKAVIFDLDGTLWDVTNATLEAANVVANKYNLESVTKEIVTNGFGRDKVSNAKLYFPKVELNKAIDFLAETSIIKNDMLKKSKALIYNNLKIVLDELKDNYNFFIVSYTSDIEYIELFFKSSGLKEYFTDYIASGEFNMKKYEAIRKIVNTYNLDEYVYVGDTRIDEEESKLAGATFIHAKYGFDKNLNSKYEINDLKELPIVLEKVFKTNLN